MNSRRLKQPHETLVEPLFPMSLLLDVSVCVLLSKTTMLLVVPEDSLALLVKPSISPRKSNLISAKLLLFLAHLTPDWTRSPVFYTSNPIATTHLPTLFGNSLSPKPRVQQNEHIPDTIFLHVSLRPHLYSPPPILKLPHLTFNSTRIAF